MNPVDWVSWLYGKCFSNHTILGGFVVCGTVVLVAFLIALAVYIRAADKYREEHSKISSSGNDAVTSGKTNKTDPIPAPTTEIPMKRSKDAANGSNSTPTIISAPNGIAIGGGVVNNPSVINIGRPLPKPLTLDGEQSGAIAENLRPFSGQSAAIFIVGGTSEAQRFGTQLQLALRAAGINADLSSAGSLMREGGSGPPPRGVSFAVGDNRLDIANVLGTVLRQKSVTEDKPVEGIRSNNPDNFTVYVVSVE